VVVYERLIYVDEFLGKYRGERGGIAENAEDLLRVLCDSSAFSAILPLVYSKPLSVDAGKIL